MKREDLLKSKEYWTVQIQNELYTIIEEYMAKNDLTRTMLAEKLCVTKGYVTQILKGDFDHKLSKFVELCLAADKVPLLHFVDKYAYVADCCSDKNYELYTTMEPKMVAFESWQSDAGAPLKQSPPKFTVISSVRSKESKPQKETLGVA